jgi:hypothetical protein
LAFLSSLQAQMPTHDCLEKHIPGLSKLYLEVKWLQEEVDITKITSAKQRLVKIFKGIADHKQLAQICAQEKAKKTPTGSGKPSAQ